MLNSHELRHSFGSILYARGVDIVTISKLMGHESIEITVKLYVHDDLDLMKNAILSGVRCLYDTTLCTRNQTKLKISNLN